MDPELVLGWSIPGGTLALVAVGTYEVLKQRRRRRTGKMLSATYVNELTAMFYGSKRMELDHRTSMSMLAEDDAQGAPPQHGVDLARGVVRLPDSYRNNPA
jgi:hypothetical protein